MKKEEEHAIFASDWRYAGDAGSTTDSIDVFMETEISAATGSEPLSLSRIVAMSFCEPRSCCLDLSS